MPIIEPTSAPAFQLRLDSIDRQLPTGRPLVPLTAVMVILDRDEDAATYLYESGLLQFAFDIASRGAGRREIRIFRGSVLAYAENNYSHLTAASRAAGDERALERAIKHCLPARAGAVPLARLHNLWSVSSTHLHDLVEDGELPPVPGQALKAKQTPLLDRDGVVAFLKRRRINGEPQRT